MTICCQCQKEYHAGCLKERGICDFEVSEDNWFCCNDCCIIHNQLTKMICKKYFPYLNNPTTRQDVHWCILSGEDRSLENRSLLSKAAAIFREAFHPIPGSCVDIVPAMLFGKSDKDHDFFGTYCAIVMIGSKVISAGMLRVFGTDIAELSLVATTKLSRRQGYFRSLFSLVEVLLTKLKVKKLILPANENVNSMWVEKFGFSVMAGSELNRYVSEIPITLFQGVLMLEKSFQISSNAITYKYTISSSIITN
ncbi:hypothetical protein ZOSMA_93G00820 [Zostera marina]|uniref:Increased DNA methylation 1 C-terminal domain-containing protein n=1 Tax=Zostera marina TaxID=29655 RepID=A0A0K9NJ39_ZOSMR|nr:hypothetical protein ZOSMA_93G00820 [Zostera marina]